MNAGPLYHDYQKEIDQAYGILGTYDYFQQLKIEMLLKMLKSRTNGNAPLRILDVGAGTGLILRGLPNQYFKIGVEPDAEMIEQAKPVSNDTNMVRASGLSLPFTEDLFDVVLLAGVLHHMNASEIPFVLRECHRVLKREGILVVFEHNAYNLFVCWFLKTFVKIDRDAHFLTPRRMKRLALSAKFSPSRPRYLCFFPGFLRFIRPLENQLHWIPVGGQFCQVSEKIAE